MPGPSFRQVHLQAHSRYEFRAPLMSARFVPHLVDADRQVFEAKNSSDGNAAFCAAASAAASAGRIRAYVSAESRLTRAVYTLATPPPNLL